VFDGLFAKEDLDALRTQTIKYGKYFYDDRLDSQSDNVQWIAGFNVDRFVNSRFWPVIHQVAEHATGTLVSSAALTVMVLRQVPVSFCSKLIKEEVFVFCYFDITLNNAS